MSKAGKITVHVQHTRNGEVISVRTVGAVGSVPVNTISNAITYLSRSSAPDPVTYFTAILNRAISQLDM